MTVPILPSGQSKLTLVEVVSKKIILLQSIYVLTMLEVVEEIPIRYQVPSTTTCNQDLEIYRRLLYFFHGTMVSANTCTTNF